MDAVFLIMAGIIACFVGGYALRYAVTTRRREEPEAALPALSEDSDAETVAPVQALVPLFSAERDFLKRENARLNSHIDRLMGMVEHEQSLRRQLQDELMRLIAANQARARIGADPDAQLRGELEALKGRLDGSERRYRRLKGAVEVLLRKLRDQGKIARAA